MVRSPGSVSEVKIRIPQLPPPPPMYLQMMVLVATVAVVAVPVSNAFCGWVVQRCLFPSTTCNVWYSFRFFGFNIDNRFLECLLLKMPLCNVTIMQSDYLFRYN